MGRPGQAGNRHTQKLPCSIWAVPTCGGGMREGRRPSLSGARFKWTDWRTSGEGKTGDRCITRTKAPPHLWQRRGSGRGCGNSANRGKQALESTTRASPPPQSPRYLTHRNFLPLSPLAYCYSFALPKTYNNTTGSLSLFTPSFSQPDGVCQGRVRVALELRDVLDFSFTIARFKCWI